MAGSVRSTAPTGQGASKVVASPGRLPGLPRLVWVAAALVVLIAGAVWLGLTWQEVPAGLPDAGRLVVDALPVTRLAMLLSGGLLLGFALSAIALDASGGGSTPRGLVTPLGRADLAVAVVAAAFFAGAATLLALLTLADVLGLSLSQTLAPGIVATYLWDVEASRAALISGALGAAIAVGLSLARTLGAAACWFAVACVAVGLPSLTGHAAGLGSHSLALIAGFVHAIAASVWAGGVVAVATHAVRRSPGLLERIRRFGVVAIIAVVALAVSGLGAAATRLDQPSELVSTTYGRMLLAKGALMLLALALAGSLRRAVRLRGVATETSPGAGRRTMVEVGVLAAAVAVAVLLARSPFPRSPVQLPSAGEEVIGDPYPPPPTVGRVALGWHPDWVWLTGALLALALYLTGYALLRARGDRWPVGRLVAWVLGWGVVVWATSAGVAWYAPVSFSLHMISHMALAMLAPVLLVLGGPVTLALRAIPAAPGGQRGPREWITWALHSPVTRFVTHPAYALLVYTVGLYGLYYTGLYTTLMSSHLGHFAMQVHFLAAGYLFYWVVIGVDPGPRRLPYSARLILLMASLVIHSLFAVPMMMSETEMVADWYALVRPPWLTDPVADSHLAGAIAWGFGELPTLAVAIALAVQWARSDDLEAKRADRRAELDGDAELTAYNARLARLNAADEGSARRDSATHPPDGGGPPRG